MSRIIGSIGLVTATLTAAASVTQRNALGAQMPDRSDAASNWAVARDPFVDLWFHCLAVVRYDGYGSLGLYDTRYADRVRDAKARAGITTTLDRRAAELRRALTTDSAFEVLHFLPLYFVGQEPVVVLSSLRAALQQGPQGPRATSGSSVSSTAAAIVASLPTAREHAVLASLIDAASDEWASFVRSDLLKRATNDRQAVKELRAAWNDRFVQSLNPYFAATGVSRGTILISPAIGGEGRIVRAPGGAVVVAVGLGRGVSTYTPLLAAVHELAFPLLDQLRTPLAQRAPRLAAAHARDAAAVRAGALMLDAVDSSLANEYRRLFVDAIGGRTFVEAYPLSSEADIELRHLVTSAMHGAASPGRSYENY